MRLSESRFLNVEVLHTAKAVLRKSRIIIQYLTSLLGNFKQFPSLRGLPGAISADSARFSSCLLDICKPASLMSVMILVNLCPRCRLNLHPPPEFCSPPDLGPCFSPSFCSQPHPVTSYREVSPRSSQHLFLPLPYSCSVPAENPISSQMTISEGRQTSLADPGALTLHKHLPKQPSRDLLEHRPSLVSLVCPPPSVAECLNK